MLGLCLLGACAGPHTTQSAANTPTPAPAPAPAPAPTPPPAAAAAPAPSVESVTIDFPSDKATISSDAGKQLDGAARLYRSAKPEVMFVTGHSDPAGQEYPNLVLSARRAEAVKQALVDRGIPASQLQIMADGTAQRVPGVTPERSAVITWR